MRARRILISLCLAAVLFQVAAGILARMRQSVAEVGNPTLAPEFSWVGLDGSKHRSAELAGHVVALHFWASWCAPCREELPSLLAAAAAHKNIIFLTVSGDELSDQAEQFIKHVQLQLKNPISPNVLYAIDPDKALALETFKAAGYPETILIDSARFKRFTILGPAEWEKERMRNILNRLK
jgi:thiol-disulfide isomerase/thioredoxin